MNYITLFRQRYVQDMNLFINDLKERVQKIQGAANTNQIRGYEGIAARDIYRRLNDIIDNEVFRMIKRDRKNPDRINSLLNFGYYLLSSRINATMRAVGLNPYLGFLHNQDDYYESLVWDLVELFRARIDRFIIRLVNLKVLTEKDFVESDNGHHLIQEATRRFLNQWEGEMEKKNPKSGLSLKENIYAQIIVLRNFFTENGSLTFYEWLP